MTNIFSKWKNLYRDGGVTSFDIFDTVITRCAMSSFGIFAYMQEQLRSKYATVFPEHIVNNFQRIRIEAEGCARKRMSLYNKQEIKLTDIYQCLAYDNILSDEQIRILIGLETDIETIYSYPIQGTISLIKYILSQDQRVIFISDMYLPTNVIRTMLVNADPLFANIPLYVSGEMNAKKSTGEIFKLVSRKEDIDYGHWVHIGDNIKSDVEVPRKLGIKTIHVDFASNDAIDRFLDAHFTNNTFAHLYGGCAKLAKLHNDSINYEIGARFGGPLLVGYAEWLLELALRASMQEIYFVSRDGFVPKRMCDAIIKARGYKIRTKYIYGSRKAFTSKDANQCELLERYILQEIDVNQNGIFIIDSFGVGKSIEEVAKIIHKHSNRPVYSAHFKRTNYLFSDRYTTKCEFAKDIDVWDNIEIIASAPEGSCLGYYSETDGTVCPLINETMTKKIVNFGYNEYIEGIDKFIEIYLKCNACTCFNSSSLDVLEGYIAILNMFPTKNLTRFLLDFPEKNQGFMFKHIRNAEIKLKKAKFLFKQIEKEKLINLIFN